jgi:hypothetical protein
LRDESSKTAPERCIFIKTGEAITGNNRIKKESEGEALTKVKCTVDNCEYWGDGQVCQADQILVKNDIAGDADQFANHFINADMTEFGDEMGGVAGKKNTGALGRSNAQTSPQTCCDTMKLKNN